MANDKTWLLVADARKARIFSLYKARIFQEHLDGDILTLIDECTHDESRMKNAELVSDRMGASGPKKMMVTSQPKTLEAEHFAHELLTRLDAGRNNAHFHDLIIVAPPNFMGILHKHMPREIEKLLSKKIEKDYTEQGERELVKSLASFL